MSSGMYGQIGYDRLYAMLQEVVAEHKQRLLNAQREQLERWNELRIREIKKSPLIKHTKIL